MHDDSTTRSITGIHVVERGPTDAPPVLLLHGWPLDSTSYRGVMESLGASCHSIAVDLPGIGKSIGAFKGGEKITVAHQLAEVLDELRLKQVTVVGQDAGGMVAYALMRAMPQRVKHAIIVDTVIPGVDPWNEVLANPYIWHFAFHAVPELPELLVKDHVERYLGFFFDTLAGHQGVSEQDRRAAIAAYASPRALHAGFEWYRAFPKDAKANQELALTTCDVPLLYLRGGDGKTTPDAYVDGFKKAQVLNVEGGVLEGAGHFVSNEQPEALATVIRERTRH